jgi:tetratricopeptide (TPR) repeat protein
VLFAVAAGVLAGCATDPFLAAGAGRFATPVELTDTPFFPQEEYQCGPAALATVLAHSGVEVTADELVPAVWLPERRGSLQPEMLAASRRYERIPYLIAPDFGALLAEVAAGHPVLVLQNLGIGPLSLWHYAVVVGFSPDEGVVLLRSGEDRRRSTPAGVFVRTWERGDHWAMVTLAPEELPAGEDLPRYLRAIAAMEATGRVEQAATAYRAAIARWPASALAHLGLGNALWNLGRASEAAGQYRQAVALAPDDVTALNNLASALASLGACGEAAALIERAERLALPGNPLAENLADTRREVDACARGSR